MILFTSNSNDVDILFFTDSSNDDFETFNDFFCENLSSVFCYPDEMTCEIVCGMGRMVIIE